jgi:Tfp pilus assembly protein PilP
VSKKLTIVLLVLLVVLAGCREQIATGPTAADMQAERARVKAQMEKGKRKKPAVAVAQATPTEGEEGSFAQVDDGYAYDAEGRRDPFQPYRVEDSVADEPGGGPLEQFELEQLAVVALVWDGARARAMVSDPSGTTYTIAVGSRMGKNAGKVIHIGDNLVLVKETYVDYAGEESTKDVELRIRRTEGG